MGYALPEGTTDNHHLSPLFMGGDNADSIVEKILGAADRICKGETISKNGSKIRGCSMLSVLEDVDTDAASDYEYHRGDTIQNISDAIGESVSLLRKMAINDAAYALGYMDYIDDAIQKDEFCKDD